MCAQLVNQHQPSQHQQPHSPAPVEIEEELISLRPIGPGVQNLEPEDPARFRSMTPAFPTQQRGEISKFQVSECEGVPTCVLLLCDCTIAYNKNLCSFHCSWPNSMEQSSKFN